MSAQLAFTDNGLLFGDPLGASIDTIDLDESDEGTSRRDKSLRERRYEQGSVQATVVFAPVSRRIYAITVTYPQEFDAAGVQTQLDRAQAVSAAMRARLGDGKLTRSNKKKNAKRVWNVDDARTTFSFTQHSNFAGWYADLQIESVLTTSVQEFLGHDAPPPPPAVDPAEQRLLDAVSPVVKRLGSDAMQARLLSWAKDGDEADFQGLVDDLRELPSGNRTMPPGPQFWLCSTALANQRLFRLRLATTHGGDPSKAFTTAAANGSLCLGETATLAAYFADQAGLPAHGTLLESLSMLSGVVVSMAESQPDVLAESLAALVNKSAFRVHAKFKLLALLPWTDGELATGKGGVFWVARWHTLVMTVKAKTDSKKATFSFKVARSLAKVDEVQAKVVLALAKKVGLSFEAGVPELPDFNTPKTDELDMTMAARAPRRAELLRILRHQAPASLRFEHFTDYVLFDLMNHGVRIERPDGDAKPAANALRELQDNVLPGHFEALCRKSWGDGWAAELEHYGVTA